jgi:hypothetical protein
MVFAEEVVESRNYNFGIGQVKVDVFGDTLLTILE